MHHVSEQAFAKARAKLSTTAIPALNDWLVERADADGFVPRWRGRRLVAADASTLRFGRRASHVARAASADQIAFGLYLPGAEMMLAASLHSVHEGERQMLFEHLERLSSGDLLLMDRGYPSRWLVAALNARGVGFCMRVEKAGNTGFACVRDFLRSDDDERIVTLAPPDRRDAVDYECPATPQTVRLVCHIASTGRVRVLMTKLLDPAAFPAHEFGDLYHQRWRIGEVFCVSNTGSILSTSPVSHSRRRCTTSPRRSFATTYSPWPRKQPCARRRCRRRGASTAPPPTPS